MMNKRIKLVIAALIAVGCIWFIVRQATRETGSRGAGEHQRTVKRGRLTETYSDAGTTATVKRRPRATPRQIAPASAQPIVSATPGNAALRAIEERARAAVAEVGVNEESETVWLAAVNNRQIPAETRAELINALTEEGFSDTDEYTDDDLPLIAARLAIVERLAPESIDETNAAAFSQALETLSDLLEQLSGESDNNS